jgi:hypothetical protein
MMGQLIGKLGTVLLLSAGVTLVSTAASASSSDSPDSKARTLSLLARTVNEVQLDLGQPGPSLGDQNVFTADLYRGRTKVGQSDGVCTITRLEGVEGVAHCIGMDLLPEGQLTFQGVLTFSGANVLWGATSG